MFYALSPSLEPFGGLAGEADSYTGMGVEKSLTTRKPRTCVSVLQLTSHLSFSSLTASCLWAWSIMKRTFDDAFAVGSNQNALQVSASVCAQPLLQDGEWKSCGETALDQSFTSQETILGKSSRNLCSHCEAINFKAIFALPRGSIHNTGLPVTDGISHIDPTCAFCALVLSLEDTVLQAQGCGSIKDNGYYLRAYDSWKLMERKLNQPKSLFKGNIVLAVVPCSPKSLVPYSVRPEARSAALRKGVITQSPALESSHVFSSHSNEYYARSVLPSWIDFSQLRTWISECQSSKEKAHSSCQLRRRSISNTHVIDCFTRNIVPLGQDHEYLALSYVWGNQEHQRLEATAEEATHTQLPRRAPATIEDTINIVKGLGWRFLWVDRYCIPTGEKRHEEIQNMGLVYEGATATIVAVAAANSDCGLPGVSSSRNPRLFVDTNAGKLASTPKHLALHTAKSTWVTRAWTYQEAFLSRRCLFFTDDQVYFACGAATCAESVLQAPPEISKLGLRKLSPNLISARMQLFSSQKTSNLVTRITEYTSRHLSFGSDGLNAFKGTLAREKCLSYWGIPFMDIRRIEMVEELDSRKVVEMSFATGLYWDCHSSDETKARPYVRRLEIPTWAWASVNAQITYVGNGTKSRSKGRSNDAGHGYWGSADCTPAVWIEAPDRSLIPLHEKYAEAVASRCRIIPEISRFLHLRGYTTKVKLQHRGDGFPPTSFRARPVTATGAAFAWLDLSYDESLLPTIESTVWDVILVEKSSGLDDSTNVGIRNCANGLLLERKGDTAYRAGCVFFRILKNITEDDLRTIRLG